MEVGLCADADMERDVLVKWRRWLTTENAPSAWRSMHASEVRTSASQLMAIVACSYLLLTVGLLPHAQMSRIS